MVKKSNSINKARISQAYQILVVLLLEFEHPSQDWNLELGRWFLEPSGKSQKVRDCINLVKVSTKFSIKHLNTFYKFKLIYHTDIYYPSYLCAKYRKLIWFSVFYSVTYTVLVSINQIICLDFRTNSKKI